VRRAAALVGVAVALAGLLNWVGASASSTDSHRRERNLRLVVTNGYFVDNDPSGQSGGDLFGSTAQLRHGGRRVGKASDACTLVPPVGGQCQVTLILSRGHIQLAGNVGLQGGKYRVAIVGGTNKFRGVRGDVTIQPVDDQGQVQHLHLTILH
jgi:hypothetical protein